LSLTDIFDHAGRVKDFLKKGVDCYMGIEAAEHLKVTDHHRVKIIVAKRLFTVGTWRIYPFPAVHDVPCFGYLMASGSNQVLYLTDSAYISPTFNNLSHIMCEVNYCPGILINNASTGVITSGERTRIIGTHFGLDNVINLLQANNLSKLQEIHALHLSDRNSDEEEIQKELTAAVPAGVKVVIAEA
jgi:phosphoribosyl 1,2-cyclic phosphodiesterase